MTIHTTHRSKETQWVPSIESKALSQSVHASVKFHLRSGRLYLFRDGSKLTDNRDWAWSGTERQAINSIVKFPAAKGCRLAEIE